MKALVKKNGLFYFFGVIVVIGLIIFNRQSLRQNDDNVEDDQVLDMLKKDTTDTAFMEETIVVDVKGEVVDPGVYETTVDARVNDIIALAGGFTAEADETPVNLAQKVQDEMTIIVPAKGDVVSAGGDISDGKVRINYATQAEIETLSGIGPSKAQAILQYRDDHGFFKKVEDLLEISGIGEKTLDNIRDELQIP